MVHSSGMSLVEFESTGTWPKSEDIVFKSPGSQPGSERILERESGVLQSLQGEIGPKLLGVNPDNGTLKMTRIGTHDLYDVMHELSPQYIKPIVSEFIHQVSDLHKLGFVHRDIKPGNVMVTMNNSRIYKVEGLIDFGMTIRINRQQNEKGVLGGTEPYCHPTQLDGMKSVTAHPGQDWYAVGRTILHLLLGGSSLTLKTFIQGCSQEEIDNHIMLPLREHWGAEVPQALCDLLVYSINHESFTEEALPKLENFGNQCVSEIKREKDCKGGITALGFQRNSRAKPKRHDLLIIVDSTGSMAAQIADLKTALREVVADLSDKIDLRIDLWSLGDYGRSESDDSTIIPLGERMTGDTFRDAVMTIDADRLQHSDEAEAYEVALQAAYLQNSWNPRQNTVRTIILIGDSYAHGWLKRNLWAKITSLAFTGQDAWKDKKAQPPDEKLQKIIRDFERRHPQYMTRDIRLKEKDAFNLAKKNPSKDAYGGRGSVEVTGEIHKHRPNFEKALDKCVMEKCARIHTISSGGNLVSHSFMKYLALMGKGTYTHIQQGELKYALGGLLAIADPEAFQELKDRVESSNPMTQALNSITTFVIDSEEESF